VLLEILLSTLLLLVVLAVQEEQVAVAAVLVDFSIILHIQFLQVLVHMQ
jgi:hypothetical protein